MTASQASEAVLREDAEWTLTRSRAVDGSSLLSLQIKGQPAPPHLRQRLEHEYSLRDYLEPGWAARPRALERGLSSWRLILDDPGGALLSTRTGAPLPSASLLRLGTALAGALGQLHERGFVHKDIQPAHVLVNAELDQAWLTGFGLTSPRSRERRATPALTSLGPSLAYVAPEQTGHMNRSVDARSDLYSCGAMLYELLSGRRPFEASDPLEWIHCHVAREPPRLDEHVPTILAAIVYKLLAKNPEDRYQTAAGLAADLRRCQARFDGTEALPAFTLASDDAPSCLLAPEAIYGRHGPLAALHAAVERVTRGSSELVLISGYSGIGKSSIVSELHRTLAPHRAAFAEGKFDQYQRDVPYAIIAQAFRSLLRQLLGLDDALLADWRAKLDAALRPNTQLIARLAPELECILGPQPDVAGLDGVDEQLRFLNVVRRFLSVFARAERPLILFLDDLQWLDPATLSLLEHLASDVELRHVLLIGAYRDNEVDAAHPLHQMLGRASAAGARVRRIALEPLTLEVVEHLVAASLRCGPGHARPLARLVYEKAGGNPFFVIQFVTHLGDERLLTFDLERRAWVWDLARIRDQNFSDSIVELMLGRLRRLRRETQLALRALACLGGYTSLSRLGLIYDAAPEALEAALWDAVAAGLIARTEEGYAFLHDHIQEAAYALLPTAQRPAEHLRIGRLLASTDATQVTENIFDVVSHYDRGTALLVDPAERERVAVFYVMAGRQARASSAYASALAYLSGGARLLPSDRWQRCPALCFELELLRADCEVLTGDSSAAEARLDTLAARAVGDVERASVACARITLYVTRDRLDAAVDALLAHLQQQGIFWSPYPTDEDVAREYRVLWAALGSRSIEQVADAPWLADATQRATLDVLASAGPPVMFTRPNLFRLIAARMVSISLRYGNCDASCSAYIFLAMVLGSHFNDHSRAFRFGQLGATLADRYGSPRRKARVNIFFAGAIMPWSGPPVAAQPLLRSSLAAALEIGDIEYATYRSLLVTNLLAAGAPLSEAQAEAEAAQSFARKTRFGLIADFIEGQLGLIRSLRGATHALGSFSREGFDAAAFERQLESEPSLAVGLLGYSIRRLQACLFAGDYATGLTAARRARELLWTAPSLLGVFDYHFYGGLTHAACVSADEPTRSPHWSTLSEHLAQLERWAAHYPQNFGSPSALLRAERARILSRFREAHADYELAIQLAREHGFVQHEALASELCASCHAEHGFFVTAAAHLRNARDAYARWGASAKVDQLERRHPELRSALPLSAVSLGASLQHVDVLTVAKAAQALSGEIVTGRLCERLLRIAIEHAAAERGSLLLVVGDEPRLEAHAVTTSDGIDVQLRPRAASSSELPESLLRYVARARVKVALDDAMLGHDFSKDSYFSRQRVRSVLCLPLVKQTELLGLLYLENNQAPHVFDTGRTTVLELLTSQAAISLENARLYADLEESQRQLDTRLRFEELRREISLVTATVDTKAGNPGLGVALRCVAEFFDVDVACIVCAGGSTLVSSHVRPASSSFRAERLLGVAQLDARREVLLPDIGAAEEQSAALRDSGAQALASIPLLVGGGIAGWLRLVSLSRAVDWRDAALPRLRVVADVFAMAFERWQSARELERADAKLEIARNELSHVTRATTLGEIAASIAHEINQPLTAIVADASACLNWLSAEQPDGAAVRTSLLAILRDGERAGQVLTRIRALLSRTSIEPTPCDVAEIVDGVLSLLRPQLTRAGVMLETRLDAELSTVHGDAIQLQQVLLNLVLNAAEACRDVEPERRRVVVQAEANRGCAAPRVSVSVIDSGIGVAATELSRLFDAFYTTKQGGLGMGLPISRSIIERHGGHLWASANSWGGMTFRFELPVCS